MASVAENNANTLGLSLDLDSRYQEAEKVRRSYIKLVYYFTLCKDTFKVI